MNQAPRVVSFPHCSSELTMLLYVEVALVAVGLFFIFFARWLARKGILSAFRARLIGLLLILPLPVVVGAGYLVGRHSATANEPVSGELLETMQIAEIVLVALAGT